MTDLSMAPARAAPAPGAPRPARPWRSLVAALLLAASLPASAQEESAVVRRATDLREAPGEAARSLAPLAGEAPVTRLGARQGPWVQVRTAAGTTGWVHLFDLGPAAGSGSVAGNALRSVTSLFSRPATQRTTTATSTIGIRGLGAEDLAQAQPDTAAVARMEGLRQTEQQARQFARQAALEPVAVDPLPVPTGAAAAPTPAGGQP